MENKEPNDCGRREPNDCSVVALSTVAGIPYDVAYMHMQLNGRLPNQPVTPSVLLNAYISSGLRILPSMRPVDLKAKLQSGKYIVWCTGHVFGIIDGKVTDVVPPNKDASVVAVFEMKG